MELLTKTDISRVFEYWFGKGGKDKWFESNPKKRAILDKDIEQKFGDLLRALESSECDFFKEDMDTRICAIIILDQFSRHIYRNDEHGKLLIQANTKRAVNISLGVISDAKKCKDLTCNYFDALPFILMPLKHHNLLNHWTTIKEELYANQYTQHPMLYRFYKDTIKKVAIKNNDGIIPTTTKTTETTVDPLFDSITDFLPKGFYRLCLHDSLPNLIPHEITDTITAFMQSFVNNLYDEDSELTSENKPIITVSLSGGVDSMITTFVLAYLSRHHLFQKRGFFLQAAHLNYLNRDVSTQEAEFVCYFCNQIDVPIYVRTIHEIQRKENNRDFYETLTRDIRFDFYRKLPRTTKYPCVILGHNHDDIIENIWTNFAKGKFLFNLRKMEQIDLQDGVTLLRPLLFTKKTIIYDFSKMFHIAYLKNTTPTWSNRGKMRNEFLPAVEKQFANQIDVEYVADTLSEYGTFIEETLFRPILNSVVFEDDNRRVIIPVNDSHLKLKTHFWQTLFGKILNSMGIGEPSRKSIQNFVKSLQKISERQLNWKCNIKKNIQVTMDEGPDKSRRLILQITKNGH